jgi:hypothetical protein
MKSCKFKIFNTNRNQIDDISVSDRDNRNLIADSDSPPQNWDIYVILNITTLIFIGLVQSYIDL